MPCKAMSMVNEPDVVGPTDKRIAKVAVDVSDPGIERNKPLPWFTRKDEPL